MGPVQARSVEPLTTERRSSSSSAHVLRIASVSPFRDQINFYYFTMSKYTSICTRWHATAAQPKFA